MIKNYKLLLLIPVLCLFAGSVNASQYTEDDPAPTDEDTIVEGAEDLG